MAKKGKKGEGEFGAEEKAAVLRAFTDEQPLEFVFKFQGKVEDLEVFDLVRTLESMKIALQEATRL